jgi:type I restriction enzyme M protein
MSQLENIEKIEKELWASADNLRANSGLPSNEYFMPVMGLIFLRHAYNRFLRVKTQLEESLPKRGGLTRTLAKEDFTGKGAIFLEPKSQFDYLVNLKDSDDRAQAVIRAMELIEKNSDTLQGVLPKSEYQELKNDLLGEIIRTFNHPALKDATGDIFGRIYEYFLTKFADQKAHDGGEFFTPVSLVQMIVNIIEPKAGVVLDPACGSGGMFVQSAHFVEHLKQNPNEKLTFYGMEKVSTTIRLAKMNLAVHGLEGNIQEAITYYEDPHELVGKADFVMANPPFNVDEVDAEKIKEDPRLPFGLPGVNQKGKVSNGNYLWISYFDSYLNKKGRAGFVMSSQASSAGGGEAKVRQKLIESGEVDCMIAIRNNFFYTRTVPCELWFFNRNKSKEYKDKVLMIDARNTYRKVTRKIYDFTPEQLKNLTSIVWLYRGEQERFVNLVKEYLEQFSEELSQIEKPFHGFMEFLNEVTPKLTSLGSSLDDFNASMKTLENDISELIKKTNAHKEQWNKSKKDFSGFKDIYSNLGSYSDTARDLIKQIDHVFKLAGRLADGANDKANHRDIKKDLKVLDDRRKEAVDQLKAVRYYYRQAQWLLEKFPEAQLRDIEGLVKVVDQKELKANDWSLSPGRYVGVAPEEVDENFDFEEALREIHVELKDLNQEAVVLAEKIQKNFEGLGI